MRIPVRLGVALSLAAIASTAACSDSSGPSNVNTAADVAAHFDSIYVDAAARADTQSGAYSTRVELATLLEVPAALGAVPSTVNVVTSSGTEHWKAYEFVELDSASIDSEFVMLAYREEAAHTVMVVFFDSTGAGHEGGIITNDTLSINPSTATAATSLTTVGTTCTTPPVTLKNPEFHTPFYSACSIASFRTDVGLTFAIPSGIDPALANLSFPFTKIAGLKVVDLEGEARRVHDALHALRTKMRAM